jgi:long-chain fatty acid transport protein
MKTKFKITFKSNAKAAIVVFLGVMVCSLQSGYGQVKPLYSYYDIYFGARSLGMGNAFTAVADDLTAVFRNPAGVSELEGPRVFVNYRTDSFQWDYPSQVDTTDTSSQQYDYNFEGNLKNLDFFSLSVPVIFWDIQWSFALSYYRYLPFGFDGRAKGTLVTDDDRSNAEVTGQTIIGSSGIDVLALTSAFYLTDYLSFGITMQFFFNSGTIAYDHSSTALSYRQEYIDKFQDQNLVLGLLVKFSPEIILGISYNTQYSAAFTSQSSYLESDSESPATASLDTVVLVPAQISVGLLLKPYKYMDLSLDYTRRYWSRSTIADFYGSPGELQFPVKNEYTFSQKDVSNLRMGVQINIPVPKATVFVRGGYSIDRPLFSDSTGSVVKLKGYSLGVGIDFSSKVRVDAAYMRQKGTWKETAYFDTSSTVDSVYINKVFALSLTFSFVKKKVI